MADVQEPDVGFLLKQAYLKHKRKLRELEAEIARLSSRPSVRSVGVQTEREEELSLRLASKEETPPLPHNGSILVPDTEPMLDFISNDDDDDKVALEEEEPQGDEGFVNESEDVVPIHIDEEVPETIMPAPDAQDFQQSSESVLVRRSNKTAKVTKGSESKGLPKALQNLKFTTSYEVELVPPNSAKKNVKMVQTKLNLKKTTPPAEEKHCSMDETFVDPSLVVQWNNQAKTRVLQPADALENRKPEASKRKRSEAEDPCCTSVTVPHSAPCSSLSADGRPSYKFQGEPVRKKQERKKLPGHDCSECSKYYKSLGLPEEERQRCIQECSRHRSLHKAPPTPAHFWDLDFPNTEEMKRLRGPTQQVQVNSRRRHRLTLKTTAPS